MSAPDYRKDLGAFLKLIYGDAMASEFTATHHHILDTISKAPRDYKDETFQWGVDHGKPGGDHTAYVHYSYDGGTIVIDDVSFEELYDADAPESTRGGRVHIPDLLTRIGQKRCNCNAGYLIREDTRQLQVCTRCDGFSTQHGRRFRART